MSTQDFNSAAGANSPMDAATYRRPDPHEDFATLIAGTANRSADVSVANDNLYLKASTTTNAYSGLDRPEFVLDLTAFAGVYGDISDVSFYVYVTAKSDGLAMGSLNLVASSPAANNSATGADWSALGTTKFSSDVTFPSSTGYLQFTLNAAGLSAVSTALSGSKILKLGLRFTGDGLGGTTPTWSSNGESYISINFADNVTNIPYLRITYSTNVSVTTPLATVNIQGLVPTLKVSITSPIANLVIGALAPTIRITGAVITNLAKSATSSMTNVTKHASNTVNQVKSTVSTWINRTKN